MKNRLTYTLMVCTALTGCGTEQTRDVEYYMSHRDELEAKLAECEGNPGELRDTPNCVNARRAKSKIIMTEGKAMPQL